MWCVIALHLKEVLATHDVEVRRHLIEQEELAGPGEAQKELNVATLPITDAANLPVLLNLQDFHEHVAPLPVRPLDRSDEL